MRHLEERFKGFTLLEAAIASGLLAAVAIVFLSIWTMMAAGIQSQRLITAHHIASSKIEKLRQTAFAALPGSGPFSDPMLNELPASSATLAISDYRGVADMRQVRVTVSWTEANNVRTYNLDTVIARGGTNPP
jgi:type II secretory pathway component PulJ